MTKVVFFLIFFSWIIYSVWLSQKNKTKKELRKQLSSFLVKTRDQINLITTEGKKKRTQQPFLSWPVFSIPNTPNRNKEQKKRLNLQQEAFYLSYLHRIFFLHFLSLLSEIFLSTFSLSLSTKTMTHDHFFRFHAWLCLFMLRFSLLMCTLFF